MNYEGVLLKMDTELGNPIKYTLKLGKDSILVNELLDKSLQISFKGFECLNCHKDRKIFRQGFCYECFYKSAEVGDWVMRPELSTAHLDIEDRDLAYEKQVQLQPHIVYLALSSNVKVGVTRKTQVPTRWIDQGASSALEILEVPNRYLAGISEVALKEHLTDKTNWRKMLKNEVPEEDLLKVKNEVIEFIPDEAKEFILDDSNNVTNLDYPVIEYPEKVKSINLTKSPIFEYVLKGIKGQYLIFEDNYVFNVRNNEGNIISLKIT